MKVAVYNKKGEKKSDIDVKSKIFNISGKEKLLSEVIVSYLANMRLAHAKTKRRGEVSGGGKKPWKQKGTGRARTGSSRNPLWRGGGIIFGPIGEENHTRIIPKGKKRLALNAALSAKKNDIYILDKLELTAPKTKEAVGILKKLPVKGKTLIIFNEKEDSNLITKSFSNIEKTNTAFYKNLNSYDVLNNDTLVFVGSTMEDTIKFLER